MREIRGGIAGMVFQEPMTALNPVKTIGEQVAETALVHGRMSRREAMEIARQTLDRVELPADRFPLDRYPHELSGGQRQRVVIAMAIAMRPKLLIADEPTTALDVTTQAQILKLLKRLVDEDGMGLIFITHDLGVVAGLADKVAIMRYGEVVEAGPTVSLFRNLQHPYSKALFEASSHVPARVPPAVAGGTPVLAVDNVVREYPLPRQGLFGPKRAFRAVDDVSLAHRARRECRAGGRERLRQVDAGARHHGAGADAGRQHRHRRRADRPAARRELCDAAPAAGGVPGPLRQLQPAPPRRSAGDRAVPPARRRRAAGSGARQAHRAGARRSGPDGRRRATNTSTSSRAASASASPLRGR